MTIDRNIKKNNKKNLLTQFFVCVLFWILIFGPSRFTSVIFGSTFQSHFYWTFFFYFIFFISQKNVLIKISIRVFGLTKILFGWMVFLLLYSIKIHKIGRCVWRPNKKKISGPNENFCHVVVHPKGCRNVK